MTIPDLALHEMNRSQLEKCCEEIGGLPPPRYGSPRSDVEAWLVASFFLRFEQERIDGKDPKEEAAKCLFEHFDTMRGDLAPHVARALGGRLPTWWN